MSRSSLKNDSGQPTIEGTVPGTGVTIGRVADVDKMGCVTIAYESAALGRSPRQATSMIALTARDQGRRAVIAFGDGRPESPIVLGLVQEPLDELLAVTRGDANRQEMDAQVDDERIELKAEREIVLRCGESSITLHKDGRILIRGKHIVSRASGPNRIKGSSIQLN